jgi:hypothetical protein
LQVITLMRGSFVNSKHFLLSSLLFALAFQNCSGVNFGQKSSSSQVQAQIESPSASPSASSASAPSPAQDPTAQQNGDGACQLALGSVAPPIVYDALPVTGAASVNFTDFLLNSSINAETIGEIGDFVADNFNVTARAIDEMDSFAAAAVNVNAATVNQVHDFVAVRMVMTAHSVVQVDDYASFFCASVQTVGQIHDLAGSVSLYGRMENGQPGTIQSIQNMGGYVSLHNFDINELGSAALYASLDNSHVATLDAAAGELILQDSIIDKVANFAGTIHLRGTSSIGGAVSSAVIIIHD